MENKKEMNKLPYQAPTLDVYEFVVECDAGCSTCAREMIELHEFTDQNGENERGYWEQFGGSKLE